MMRQEQDQQSKIFYELSSLVLNILRSPPTPVDFSDGVVAPMGSSTVERRGRRSRWVAMEKITPAGFASLMLGVSLTLMLCGSLTFFIGFMLMPWVIVLVLVVYVVGIVSSLGILGRAILCPKDGCSSWKLM